MLLNSKRLDIFEYLESPIFCRCGTEKDNGCLVSFDKISLEFDRCSGLVYESIRASEKWALSSRGAARSVDSR